MCFSRVPDAPELECTYCVVAFLARNTGAIASIARIRIRVVVAGLTVDIRQYENIGGFPRPGF